MAALTVAGQVSVNCHDLNSQNKYMNTTVSWFVFNDTANT